MADNIDTILPTGPLSIIESIIRDEGIERYAIGVKSAVPKGQNFTGAVYRVTVTGDKEGRDVALNYIVKVAAPDEASRAGLPLTRMYAREALYYTELLPIYKQLQEEAGIAPRDQFKFAKCVHADNEYLNEYVIFEDLKSKGYFPVDRLADAEYNHTLCAMEAYGKLHAMSFVLKKRHPEKFSSLIRSCTEVLCDGDWWTSFNKNAFKRAKAVVKDGKYKDIFKRYENGIVDYAAEALKQDEYSVLSHSDCWATNLLYKYEDGKPVETCLIDFQLARYGPPTADLLHFLFSNTGQKLRQEHYEDLLLAYHSAMKGHLSAFSYDIEDVYPWTRFKRDLHATSLYALSICLCVMLVTLSEGDLTPNINDLVDMEKSALCKSEANDIYKDRVRGMVEDFVNYGYIR